MDNQRLIIWGFFAVMAYLTWQQWMLDYAPQPQPAAETVEATASPTDGLDDIEDLPDVSAPDDELPSASSSAGPDSNGTTAATVKAAQGEIITVTTDVVELHINTRGGTIQSARMLNYPVAKDQPENKVNLLGTGASDLGQVRTWLRSDDQTAAPDANAVFNVSASEFTLSGADELVVPMTWTNGAGVTVEKRFILARGGYAIRVEQELTNGGATTWRGDQVTQIRRRSFEQERSMFDVDSYSFDGPQVFDGESAEKLDRDDLMTSAYEFTSTNGWYASIQHHFLSAIVPQPETTNVFHVSVRDNRLTASVIEARRAVEPGTTATFERTLFIGPKLQSQLEETHPRLALSVDYGWLTLLSDPMFWLLSFFYGFVGNWGWAIILVTIVIKLVFYKLTESSGRSMAKMREIQPRMQALQERYKDDRQALSQAMMDLYKREKVNPAAGCLPILIQMPFFLAFYWVLVESVEMRQAEWALWITDLSVRDPYFILPLIMGGAMLFQQKLNPAPADPVQARVMQIMPVMFTAFFAFFPSGLVLYWVTNTLLSIAQQWKINKVVHAETVAAKQRGNKKNKKNKKKNDAQE